MNPTTFIIRLVLDTTQPKEELDDFDKEVKDTKRETERSFGDRMKSLGGVAAGFVAGHLTAQTKSSWGTVLSETIGPYASQFENWVFGGQQLEARAAQSAREQTIQAMSYDVAAKGLTKGHQSYFEQMKSMRLMEERGRQIIESNPDMYGGLDMGKAFDRLANAVADGIKSGIDYLWSKL